MTNTTWHAAGAKTFIKATFEGCNPSFAQWWAEDTQQIWYVCEEQAVKCAVLSKITCPFFEKEEKKMKVCPQKMFLFWVNAIDYTQTSDATQKGRHKNLLSIATVKKKIFKYGMIIRNLHDYIIVIFVSERWLCSAAAFGRFKAIIFTRGDYSFKTKVSVPFRKG